MINDLWQSFGILGLASIAAWVALGALAGWFLWRHRLMGVGGVVALAVLIGYALAAAAGIGAWVFAGAWVLLVVLGVTYVVARRWDALVVLAVAIVVLGGAGWNSLRVSSIEALPSPAALAAAERARQARLGALTTHATAMRFAEDSEADRLDLAGVSAERTQSIYEAAAAGGDEPPLYRQGGKVERDAGKQRTDAATQALTSAAADRDITKASRALPEDVVNRAQRYDRMNRFIARFGFLLAVGLITLDYVRRLNRTRDALPPLPVAGVALDALSPKSRSVWWQTGRSDEAEAYLRRVVRRGEAFLVFSAGEPFADRTERLPRLQAFGWGAASMPVHRTADEREPAWVLETLWFGRGSFVVRGESDAATLRDALLAQLKNRHIPRARVRRTAHVVWNLPQPPDGATIEALVYLCREANMKLTIFATTPCPEALRDRFEEVLDETNANQPPRSGRMRHD